VNLDISAKTAVVTGASQGIGLATVRALTTEGIQVVGGARTLSPQLRNATPLSLRVDLATPDGPQQLIDYALSELGGIDLLVNNVGGSDPRPGGFLTVDDAQWRQSFDTTLFSAVRAVRAVLPSLIERRGRVVNIGSVNSRLALPNLVDYSAAKAALANFGKSLAEEFAAQGVRVNTISPGPVRTRVWTETGGTGDALAAGAGMPLEEFIEQIPAATGMSTGRMTEPEEIAALVVYLASEQAANVSGSDYVIDGGMLKTV